MTRVALDVVTNDPALSKNFIKLNEVINGGISLDNLRLQPISGTTASTPDTEKLFNHSSSTQPSLFIPCFGDVYCQGIDQKYADIRATKPGVNFSGFLLIGNGDTKNSPIPSLIATGNDDYVATGDGETTIPPNSFGDLDDALVAQNPGISTTIGGLYLDCVTDGTYFYLTNTGVVNYLIRIERATGTVTSLALGSIQLSALYLSGTTLYVASRAFNGVSSIDIYEVSTSTFTLTATHTGTSISNTQKVAALYTDGSNFYFTSSTATNNSRIHKFAVGGGAVTSTTLGSSNKSARGLIEHSNGSLYVTEDDTSVALSRVYKVTKSSLAVAATYTTSNRRWLLGRMVAYGNYILMPAGFYSSKSSTSQAITYGQAVLVLDTVGGTFSEVPVQCGGNVSKNFPENLVYDSTNDFIYMAAVLTGGGVIVVQGDLINGTQRTKWYPLSTTTNGSGTALNNILVQDTDGTPLLISDPGTTGDSFTWLPVSFDDTQDTQTFGSFI